MVQLLVCYVIQPEFTCALRSSSGRPRPARTQLMHACWRRPLACGYVCVLAELFVACMLLDRLHARTCTATPKRTVHGVCMPQSLPPRKCYPLKLSGYEYMYSEADVASAVSVRICRCMLLKYAKRATGLSASMEPWWTLEDEPSSLLAGPLHQAERTFVVNNVVSAAAVGQHALEQQSTGVLDHSAWAACSPSSAGGSSRYIVLNLSLRRQGVGVAPGPYKPAMMVQVERISVLMEDGQTPLDLLAVYKDPSHKMHGLVKRVVAQVRKGWSLRTLAKQWGCLDQLLGRWPGLCNDKGLSVCTPSLVSMRTCWPRK